MPRGIYQRKIREIDLNAPDYVFPTLEKRLLYWVNRYIYEQDVSALSRITRVLNLIKQEIKNGH